MILSYSVVQKGRKENDVRTTRALTITLPSDMAQMVKDKVASGEYASESEVIRDGLRSLAQRDAAIERWLREEVVQTIAGVDEGTTQLMTLDEAKQRLHHHIEALGAKHKRS
nr:type II toxin-antitoxin system ParD family antitoxin [Pseudaminobacter soli]